MHSEAKHRGCSHFCTVMPLCRPGKETRRSPLAIVSLHFWHLARADGAREISTFSMGMVTVAASTASRATSARASRRPECPATFGAFPYSQHVARVYDSAWEARVCGPRGRAGGADSTSHNACNRRPRQPFFRRIHPRILAKSYDSFGRFHPRPQRRRLSACGLFNPFSRFP